MLTFQILDGGETYYRPLDAEVLTIGSSDDADIRISGSGIAPIHATVERTGETPDRVFVFRVREGLPAVRINGIDLVESPVVLGDRIEIGPDVVLVMGNQVKRRATPTDVLATAPVTATRRRAALDDKRSGRVRWMYASVLIAGAAVAFGLYLWGGFEQGRHLSDQDREQIVQARRRGEFDTARRVLDRLDETWVKEDAGRRQLVADHRRLVEATAAEFARLHSAYMAEVATVSKAEQLVRLRQKEKAGPTEAEREAARILASSLTEYRLAAEARLTPGRGPSGAAQVAQREEDKAKGSSLPDLPAPTWLDSRLAQIRKLHEAREFLQAYELANQALPEVPAKHAEPLLDLLADIRTEARAEMRSLVNQAYELRKRGQLKAGVKLLEDASMRFPTEGELSMLYHAHGLMAAELGVPLPRRPAVATARPASVPEERPDRSATGAGREGRGENETEKPTPAVVSVPSRGAQRREPDSGDTASGDLAVDLEKAAAAEQAGKLDEAIALLDGIADRSRDYQPRRAAALRGQVRDLELIRALIKSVTAQGNAIEGLVINLPSGAKGTVQRFVGYRVQVLEGSEARELNWIDLGVPAAATLATAASVPDATRLGIGALGYRRGEPDVAEAFLAKLLGRDRTLGPRVSVLVARGRGETPDAEGYALVKGKFVARRFLRVEALAKKFASKLSRLARLAPGEREALLASLRDAEEEGADDALVMALRSQFDGLVAKLAKSSLPKSLEKIRQARVKLDAARDHARSLIYDTKTYFYPYRPPAVSGAKHSEYIKVQAEVDDRVAALRKLWLTKDQVRISKVARSDIDLLMWLERQLSAMGEVTDRALAKVDWVRTIPPVQELSVRNFCKDAAEVEAFRLALRIEEFNEAVSEELGAGEVEQVEITNSYRRMFGHRPLAISKKIYKAARGHAVEMATLGYFSHTSPTEGRETPFKRMRNEGYQAGISENIAGNPSAAGAHDRWCHSSGHHRNLLNPGHTEFGVGNSGRLWVQCFGRGRDFENEAEFPK